MYYFKNKKTGKYLDYKYRDVDYKKDAYGYDRFSMEYERDIHSDYNVVDENDNIVEVELYVKMDSL